MDTVLFTDHGIVVFAITTGAIALMLMLAVLGLATTHRTRSDIEHQWLQTNEWNLLKVEFDALVHNEGVHEDKFEQFFDDGICRRFGELIAWAAGHKARGNHGPWPPWLVLAHPSPL